MEIAAKSEARVDWRVKALKEGEAKFRMRADSGDDGDAGEEAEQAGSNAFAVSPARSGDNTTRLLSNSHQPYRGGVAWYELVVDSDEG